MIKYLNQSGTDLSLVYASYTTDTKTKTNKYKTSTGLDLSDLFAPYLHSNWSEYIVFKNCKNEYYLTT
jgi:hypothetical protein